jgi:RNase P/RNase MRP subunit p30
MSNFFIKQNCTVFFVSDGLEKPVPVRQFKRFVWFIAVHGGFLAVLKATGSNNQT